MDAAQRIAELEQQVADRDRIIAAQRVRIEQLEAQVEQLTRLVAQLTARLDRHSGNSHLPPSSDGPGGRRGAGGGARKPPGSKGKRGAQGGHKGHRRELLPPEQVTQKVDLFPEACEQCCAALPRVPDPDGTRYQIVELPVLRPDVTEYQRHSVSCSCGHTTRAQVVGVVPQSPFGPRLTALVGLLTGVYHIGRRRVGNLLDDVFGISISLGAISAAEHRVATALEGPMQEVRDAAEAASVKHVDATSWLEAGKLRSLWAMATKAVTLFQIFVDGTARTIYPLFGACHGILVSDRAPVFAFWDPSRRQICWAHLLRKFVSFSELGGLAGRLGQELVEYGGLLFRYWHDLRQQKMTRAQFCQWMQPVRTSVERCLDEAARGGFESMSGACADILSYRQALWKFVDRLDVEPTNNHAERELRGFVLWRKRCFGAQSARGHVFAERAMTVAHTARKQKKNVFGFLVAACAAQRTEACAPKLLALPAAG